MNIDGVNNHNRLTPRFSQTDALTRAIQTICSQFTEQDDDFIPVLFLEHNEQTVVAVVSEFMVNDQTKDTLADEVIPALTFQHRPTSLAFVASAWSVTGDEQKLEKVYTGDVTEPRNSPFRSEIVIATIVTKEGIETAAAEIYRHSNRPPTLGNFIFGESGGGRFVASMTAALAAVTLIGDRN